MGLYALIIILLLLFSTSPYQTGTPRRQRPLPTSPIPLAQAVESRLDHLSSLPLPVPPPATFHLTTRTCNQALSAFSTHPTHYLRALRLFKRMRTLVANHPSCASIAPNIITYSTLMSAAITLNKPKVAIRLFHLLQASDTPLDTRAINILMNAYAKTSSITDAINLLSDLTLNTTHLLPEGTQSHPTPQPNTITYNSFLHACQHTNSLSLARATLKTMPVPRDVISYTTVISTCVPPATNNPDVAFELVDECVLSGLLVSWGGEQSESRARAERSCG